MTDRILGFSTDTYAHRRAKVLESLGDGAMILSSAPVLFRSRDTEYRYRPDSELFYLTGCTLPGVVAVLRGAVEEGRFVLFVPPRNPKEEIWSGPRMGPAEAQEMFGAEKVFPLEDLGEELPKLLRKPRRLFYRLGDSARLETLVVEALRFGRQRGPRKGDGPRGVEDPGQILDDLRIRKDPEEVSRIREATGLTVDSFREAMEGARPGMGEWEVESLLEAGFRSGGGRGPAFPTIVGSGKNACTLHYSANEHTIDDGDLILLDGGAEVGLYSGDVTRTFPANGRFSSRQRELYSVVRAAHRSALEMLRPGNEVAEIHQAASAVLTQGLADLGVLDGKVEDLLEAKAHEPYFPHQTSHWLGLDVHDVGDYAHGGSPRLLEPGMVLTVEPGLYFPVSEGEDPGPFAGIGIRIEDDVLVTEEGFENLTGSLPVELEGLEELLDRE